MIRFQATFHTQFRTRYHMPHSLWDSWLLLNLLQLYRREKPHLQQGRIVLIRSPNHKMETFSIYE